MKTHSYKHCLLTLSCQVVPKGHTNLFKFILSFHKFKFTYLTCLSVHVLLLATRHESVKELSKTFNDINTKNLCVIGL